MHQRVGPNYGDTIAVRIQDAVTIEAAPFHFAFLHRRSPGPAVRRSFNASVVLTESDAVISARHSRDELSVCSVGTAQQCMQIRYSLWLLGSHTHAELETVRLLVHAQVQLSVACRQD